MESSFIIPCLLLLLLQFLCLAAGQVNYFPIFRCRDDGNFTRNSTYETNLKTAFASLSATAATGYGFYNTSAGVSPNAVTAIALCRGDVGSETCRDCIRNSIVLLRQNCANQLEALIWSSNCSVRYSNRTYTSVVDVRPNARVSSSINASDIDVFDKALRNLEGRLRVEAAGGNSLRKFATGDVGFGPDSSKIYALMQCSPDLSSFDCNSCLSVVYRESQGCCDGEIDVGVFYPSCSVRYSNASFYNDPPAIKLPSPPPSSPESPAIPGGTGNSRKSIYVIVPVACVLGGILVIIGLCLFIKRRRKNNIKDAAKKESGTAFSSLVMNENQNNSANLAQAGSVGSLQFDLFTIEAATNSFFDGNKIGQGGFGPVYKGVLANGMEVAVKRLSKSSGQGSQEFINEVILMAKLQHRNLVRLLGFCLDADEKLLIYEYVSNKSLDYFLFSKPKHQIRFIFYKLFCTNLFVSNVYFFNTDPNRHGQLDWPKRYKIIGGITRGMLYLHEDSRLRIIHRDLKVSNILLDFDMNPKISDFGLARIVGVDQIEVNTNRIVGTYGYMSPEYAMHGHFSVKSDVFAFGIVVLEIITGKKCSRFYNEDDHQDLSHFAWKSWIEGRAMELVDPTIVETCSEDEVMRCINIALLCVQEDVDARPSMAYVLNILNNYSIDLPTPTRTPHYLPKRHDSYSSNSKSVSKSTDESLITNVYAR
ncbi:cysteine-rich receptor-like protein kinase 10 isoform X2 [Lactuca sativa]|uniref:cysteine-rich receptor-like protein kinase 10 isoform X2 n=1 Tax=Lactuca sativa TaxID=4236 RepID=UPI001C6919BF|nr:cysteine-rich receptor-like protein kinase 10 isoform X2 [Lactuca sativa]